ncbi:unnamed protein product [Zymoseptoria tritici ST99CH_1A5]|uniref:Uncharacterized protein n=1 Tax=Zymoseptoria tritici ST99CH_1A5 TaxID=1276529 RepID=A0A1Y6LPR6_ZYMTR|nr:unnamed protein product [Zymoseptoria tritici ST99CH_1A5]
MPLLLEALETLFDIYTEMFPVLGDKIILLIVILWELGEELASFARRVYQTIRSLPRRIYGAIKRWIDIRIDRWHTLGDAPMDLSD